MLHAEFQGIFKIAKVFNSFHVATMLFICQGGRVVQWCWVNFQCRGVLLIWIRAGQGPAAHAVAAGGGCLDISLSSIISLSFSRCLGDVPI